MLTGRILSPCNSLPAIRSPVYHPLVTRYPYIIRMVVGSVVWGIVLYSNGSRSVVVVSPVGSGEGVVLVASGVIFRPGASCGLLEGSPRQGSRRASEGVLYR